MDHMQGKSYVEWSPEEVSDFVISLGVGDRYAEVGQQLFEAGVNGEFFITLKDDDLKDLGVALGFDRKRIIFAIDKLINPPEEPPDSLSPRRSRSRPSRSPNNIEPNNQSPRASEQPSVHRLSRREVPPPPQKPHPKSPSRPQVQVGRSRVHGASVDSASSSRSNRNYSVQHITVSKVPQPRKNSAPPQSRVVTFQHAGSKSRHSIAGIEPGSPPIFPEKPVNSFPPSSFVKAEQNRVRIENIDIKSYPHRDSYELQDKFAFEEGPEVHEKQMDFIGRDLPDLPKDPQPVVKPQQHSHQQQRDGVDTAEQWIKTSPYAAAGFDMSNNNGGYGSGYVEEDLCWLCDVCSGPNDMDTLICAHCGTEHTDEPDGLELLHLQPTRPSNVHEAEMDFGSNIQVLCMVNDPMPEDMDRMINIVNLLYEPERTPVYLDIVHLGNWIAKAEFMEFLYLLGFEFTEQGPCCHDIPPPQILQVVNHILKDKRMEIQKKLANRSNYRMLITGMEKNERQSMIEFFKSYFARYEPMNAERFMDGILMTFNQKITPKELTEQLRSLFEDNGRIDLASNIAVTTEQDNTIANEEEFAALQLISFLSHESFLDDKDVIGAFFLFHVNFSSSLQVLRAIDMRFNSCGDGRTEEQARRIRIKLINLIKFWSKHYPEDLLDDACQEYLEQIIQKMETNPPLQGICSQLRAIWKNVDIRRKVRSDTVLSDTPVSKHTDVLSENPMMIANQLSLMDQELFAQIRDREFVGKSWMRADKHVKARGIMKMIRRFEGVSRWAKLAVLRETNQDRRKERIKWLIKVCLRLRELNNCGSLMAIYCALSSHEVQKFDRAWNKVFEKSFFNKRDYSRKWSELQELLSTSRNHKKLREHHMNMPAPAIPHIGCVLKDLVRIDDSEKRRASRMDFFVKFRKSQIVIDRIKRFQQFPYDLRPYPMIQSALQADFTVQSHMKASDIDALWVQALETDGYELPQRIMKKRRSGRLLHRNERH